MFRALWLVLVEGICWFEGDEMRRWWCRGGEGDDRDGPLMKCLSLYSMAILKKRKEERIPDFVLMMYCQPSQLPYPYLIPFS